MHYREVAPDRVGEIVAAVHQLGAQDGLRVTGGRMVVELRPDLDWDKGTTLAWIRERLDPSGALLPIYIGDDLTDEDAFDAVQFDGIGIVVGHDEDGDRRTAARLQPPEPRSGTRIRSARVTVAGLQTSGVGRGMGLRLRRIRSADREAS